MYVIYDVRYPFFLAHPVLYKFAFLLEKTGTSRKLRSHLSNGGGGG